MKSAKEWRSFIRLSRCEIASDERIVIEESVLLEHIRAIQRDALQAAAEVCGKMYADNETAMIGKWHTSPIELHKAATNIEALLPPSGQTKGA